MQARSRASLPVSAEPGMAATLGALQRPLDHEFVISISDLRGFRPSHAPPDCSKSLSIQRFSASEQSAPPLRSTGTNGTRSSRFIEDPIWRLAKTTSANTQGESREAHIRSGNRSGPIHPVHVPGSHPACPARRSAACVAAGGQRGESVGGTGSEASRERLAPSGGSRDTQEGTRLVLEPRNS